MNAPFTALTVLQRFVHTLLSADAALTAALGGAGRLYPNVSPSGVNTRHLVHQNYAGVRVAKPSGAPLGMVSMHWAFTAWEPSYSQQALEPVMEAVMAVLIRPDTRGRTHRYVDGARTWGVTVDYVGPDIVGLEVAPAGVWAPVREVYDMALRQAP